MKEYAVLKRDLCPSAAISPMCTGLGLGLRDYRPVANRLSTLGAAPMSDVFVLLQGDSQITAVFASEMFVMTTQTACCPNPQSLPL